MGKQGRYRVSGGVIALLLVTMLFGAVVLQYSIDSDSSAAAGLSESSPYDTARSVLNVLGGVRQALSAYMWTKTDEVFHEYLGASISHDQALFPYYWLITRLDPHFTMAFYYASWTLARLGRVDDGFNLALEGLRQNPYSAVLQDNLASMYFYFKKDPLKARYHILKAIDLTSDPQQKAVYETFLGAIDQVIAGKRKIPDVVPFQHVNRLNQQVEEQEHQNAH
jgi:hypothetical protein